MNLLGQLLIFYRCAASHKAVYQSPGNINSAVGKVLAYLIYYSLGQDQLSLGEFTVSQILNSESELFLVVQNLTDKDPEVFPRFGANPVDPASNPTYYDILGRELRFGVRIKF